LSAAVRLQVHAAQVIPVRVVAAPGVRVVKVRIGSATVIAVLLVTDVVHIDGRGTMPVVDGLADERDAEIALGHAVAVEIHATHQARAASAPARRRPRPRLCTNCGIRHSQGITGFGGWDSAWYIANPSFSDRRNQRSRTGADGPSTRRWCPCNQNCNALA